MPELTEKAALARDLLEKSVQKGQTLTYRDFASEMNFTEAPVIAKCTQILEHLMSEDANNNRPILSAMVVQQGSESIPRLGFYQYLNALNLYQGDMVGAEAMLWHQQEMIKLKQYYPNPHIETRILHKLLIRQQKKK